MVLYNFRMSYPQDRDHKPVNLSVHHLDGVQRLICKDKVTILKLDVSCICSCSVPDSISLNID